MRGVRFTFAQAASFVSDWRRLGLTDGDLRELESQIMQRPDIGPVMRGTRGLRKMRFSPESSGRGKSGSLRVCYVCFPEFGTVYLLLLYAKNEKDNLTDAERAHVRNWIGTLRRGLEEE
jgi:hypothetical protein